MTLNHPAEVPNSFINLEQFLGINAGLVILCWEKYYMYLIFSIFKKTGVGFCVTSSLALLLRLEIGIQTADSAGSPLN